MLFARRPAPPDAGTARTPRRSRDLGILASAAERGRPHRRRHSVAGAARPRRPWSGCRCLGPATTPPARPRPARTPACTPDTATAPARMTRSPPPRVSTVECDRGGAAHPHPRRRPRRRRGAAAATSRASPTPPRRGAPRARRARRLRRGARRDRAAVRARAPPESRLTPPPPVELRSARARPRWSSAAPGLERHDAGCPDRSRSRAAPRRAVGARATPSTTRWSPPRRGPADPAASAALERASSCGSSLFVIQLQPSWSLERMAEHHDRLLARPRARRRRRCAGTSPRAAATERLAWRPPPAARFSRRHL